METINEHFVLTGTFLFSPRPDYPELMWTLLKRNLSVSDFESVKKILIRIQDGKGREVVIDIAAQVDASTQLVGTDGYLSVKITNYQLLSYYMGVYVSPNSSTLTERTNYSDKEFFETSVTTNYRDGYITGKIEKVVNNTNTWYSSPPVEPYSTITTTYDGEGRVIRIIIESERLAMRGYTNIGDTSVVEITDFDGNLLSSQRFTRTVSVEDIYDEMWKLYKAKYQHLVR